MGGSVSNNIFLLLRYRSLETKIKLYENFDKVEEIKVLKESINKIESELNYIKEKYGSWLCQVLTLPQNSTNKKF